MHRLVRDLYKRVLLVGHDYPHPQGIAYVKQTWKKALRNPENCPACFAADGTSISTADNKLCEKELHKAVARGRHMVREMIGVIQLKKYRTLKARYDSNDDGGALKAAMVALEQKGKL